MTIDFSKYKSSIILASASPRRNHFITDAGLRFTVRVSEIDESRFSTEGLSSAEYAEILALAKAKDVAAKEPEALVIGADTVVDFKGEIIGKPTDHHHAEEITRKLFSAPHEVVTALALVRLSDGAELIESDTTKVYPRKLTAEQIADHIRGRTWQGRAGAYGIKESGEEFVERIEGSFTNVVGMPMELLDRMLKRFFKNRSAD